MTKHQAADSAIALDGESLTIHVAQQYIASWHSAASQPVSLTPDAWQRIDASAAFVERLAQGDAPVYGVTTGVGDLARQRIPAELSGELQRNILRSHAA